MKSNDKQGKASSKLAKASPKQPKASPKQAQTSVWAGPVTKSRLPSRSEWTENLKSMVLARDVCEFWDPKSLTLGLGR